MFDIAKAADMAEAIIGGFAGVPTTNGYKVMNLNNGRGVASFRGDELLIETNMDDIELSIARKTLAEALTYGVA